MKCLRKVKTANAWFQNGTFTGFLAFEMNSSPIHVYNTIQVPSFCTVFPFYLPFFLALSPFLALVTISKYVLPNLGSTYLPYNISSVEIRWTCLCPYDLWPCFQNHQFVPLLQHRIRRYPNPWWDIVQPDTGKDHHYEEEEKCRHFLSVANDSSTETCWEETSRSGYSTPLIKSE